MTRGPNAGVMSLLRRRCVGLVSVWTITRRDGQVHRFTTHNQPIDTRKTLGFSPRPGITSFAHRREAGFRANTTELSGAVAPAANPGNPPGVTYEDLVYGRLRGATASSQFCNWEYSFHDLAFDNWDVDEITYDEREWSLRMVSRLGRAERKRGVVLSRDCINQLGVNDNLYSFCRAVVTGSPERVNTTITSTSGRDTFTVSSLSRDTGYYDYGTVRVYTGNNAGLEDFVVSSSDLGGGFHQITLAAPMPGAFASGDSVELTTGCNKEFETCRVKFSQHRTSYRGFKDIGGGDDLLRTPAAS